MTEMADRVEQFANRFVPRVRDLTARLASSQREREIYPGHPNRLNLRSEIVNIEQEFSRMLDDLVRLTNECEAYLLGKELFNATSSLRSGEQRIAAAVREMTALIQEYAKERDRIAALSKRLAPGRILRRNHDYSSTQRPSAHPPAKVGGGTVEFLIGSRRFH